MSVLDRIPFLGFLRKRKQVDAARTKDMLTARFLSFKHLLSANTEAHDLFAELEETLRTGQGYGMHYVRALSTRISASIFRMVKHLNELSGGSYEGLFERFKDIQFRINPHLAPPHARRGGPLVMPLSEVRLEHAGQCGSKIAMMCDAAANLDIPTPPGFVVTAEGYRRFIVDSGLKEEIDRRIQSRDCERADADLCSFSGIMQLVVNASLPDELEQAILDGYRRIEEQGGEGVHVAMRSSALGEDSEGMAFAGQHRSVLNVDAESLITAYKEVVASKWSVQANAYRANRGIRDEDVSMCVGCMAMVDARSSGVAYSSSPVNFNDDRVRIYSVWGLPKAVVDGSTATDDFRVARDPETIESSRIAEKRDRYVCQPHEGTCRLEMDEDEAKAPSLVEGQVLAVARLAVRLERHFGHPQDIEWAYDHDGTLTLLQCRPLLESGDEVLAPLPDDISEPLINGGQTASPGVAFGVVHAVRKDAHTMTFPDGGILVVKHALPRRAALLNRAAAVVAEQGSPAGHLANVAREFGVPAVFGLKGALDALSTGMTITVDADSGMIFEGKVDALLKRKRERRDLMRGSPVRKALVGAARHILRLRLLNPDSPDFRIRNCRTFHDIMRFCHEKAVQEMFHFSMDPDVQQAAARRVLCDVPKQFWVLNLDDGFSSDALKRLDGCIHVDEIESVPMHALWDGMMAVPWEGPPPVNARGFMSVMFEATANPNLDPASRSEYAARNYFMISKHYCSLQSRFGFHFCGAEAYVSDRAAANYASFQFKGGAADLKRRILRARFIAEFLEDYDFRVKVREDSLFARVEGLEEQAMIRRLKVLGYLIAHTRQIDMIMADSDAVSSKRSRFNEDLKKLQES